MSKYLVTGGCGFIGSHLSERLIETGNDVTVFDRYTSDNSLGWLENSPYKNQINFVLGDIRDFDIVSKSIASQDGIFHLAALIGIPYSYVSPLAYVKTNIEGTYNVLEAAKNNEVSDVVVTSTSETYGTAQYVPIDENHPKVGQSPYSASKIAADQLAISYFRSFDMQIKIARPFNTYGPRQSSRAIIPSIISQLLIGKDELFLGNTSPTRDLTYVADTVEGLINIMKSKTTSGKEINIGMSEEISIGSLATKIANILGKEVEIKLDPDRSRPIASEVERLYCDNSLLKEHTNWTPKYTLDLGLNETIKFMKTFPKDSLIKQSNYLI